MTEQADIAVEVQVGDFAETPESEAEAMRPYRASLLLGVGRRRLQQLVKAGELVTVGQGHGKLITQQSVALLIDKRKRETISRFLANPY